MKILPQWFDNCRNPCRSKQKNAEYIWVPKVHKPLSVSSKKTKKTKKKKLQGQQTNATELTKTFTQVWVLKTNFHYTSERMAWVPKNLITSSNKETNRLVDKGLENHKV